MVYSGENHEPERHMDQVRNTQEETRQRPKPKITVSVRSTETPCLCASQNPEERLLARLANRSKTFVPWTLRLSSLLVFIGFLAALISTLEVLVHLSDKRQGLATSTEDEGYLWKYYPTASKWLDTLARPESHYIRMVYQNTVELTLTTTVLSVIAIYWSNLEYHSKVLMPWTLLTEKDQSAESTLRLDYVSLNSIVALWTSIRRRHYPVIAAAVGSLAIVLIIVVSTGLFVLLPTDLERSAMMTVTSRFGDTGLNRGSNDSFPVLIASSVLSKNLSIAFPPYTNGDYATESFESQSHINSESHCICIAFESTSADLAVSHFQIGTY